jgi:hypothetical protein
MRLFRTCLRDYEMEVPRTIRSWSLLFLIRSRLPERNLVVSSSRCGTKSTTIETRSLANLLEH